MQFYDVSTFDYKLVREENNGVYIGDNFYTVQDADVSYPISVLVDANDQPVCRIDWYEHEILPYEEEPEEPEEADIEPSPIPSPLGYGGLVLPVAVEPRVAGYGGAVPPEPEWNGDRYDDREWDYPQEEQEPHIFNPDQIINYNPARDAGEANFYGHIYQVLDINTEPQIYDAGHHIGYIQDNVAHFF
jgi:hypothetical protein